MAQITNEWTGANGLVYYGDVLLFADNWTAQIVMDTVDITNLSVYEFAGKLPAPLDANNQPGNANLPFPDSLPDTNLPWDRKSIGQRKQSQYGAARINIDSGLRVANITCSGLCATYSELIGENVLPRIGNYVYLQFSNAIDEPTTVFNFPKVLIKEVTFEWGIKNYQRWTLTGISTGDFDIFPGTNPA